MKPRAPRSVQYGQDPMSRKCSRGHVWIKKGKKYEACPGCFKLRQLKKKQSRKRASAEMFGKTKAGNRKSWIDKSKKTMRRFLDCWKQHPDGHFALRKDKWQELLDIKEIFEVLATTKLMSGKKKAKKEVSKREQV